MAGGTAITIRGGNFGSGAAVTIGGDQRPTWSFKALT
jgi:hypothetical protein